MNSCAWRTFREWSKFYCYLENLTVFKKMWHHGTKPSFFTKGRRSFKIDWSISLSMICLSQLCKFVPLTFPRFMKINSPKTSPKTNYFSIYCYYWNEKKRWLTYHWITYFSTKISELNAIEALHLGVWKLSLAVKCMLQLTLICMKYFRNVTAWNVSPGTHKRKCSIK